MAVTTPEHGTYRQEEVCSLRWGWRSQILRSPSAADGRHRPPGVAGLQALPDSVGENRSASGQAATPPPPLAFPLAGKRQTTNKAKPILLVYQAATAKPASQYQHQHEGALAAWESRGVVYQQCSLDQTEIRWRIKPSKAKGPTHRAYLCMESPLHTAEQTWLRVHSEEQLITWNNGNVFQKAVWRLKPGFLLGNPLNFGPKVVKLPEGTLKKRRIKLKSTFSFYLSILRITGGITQWKSNSGCWLEQGLFPVLNPHSSSVIHTISIIKLRTIICPLLIWTLI